MQQGGHVYILSNADHSMLYVGATSSLGYRVEQHLKKVQPESFTARYDCNRLVYYKHYSHLDEAKAEEKRIKELDKEQKAALVTAANADWKDLLPEADML